MDIDWQDVKSMLTVALAGVIGIVFAIIINELYNRGIVVDELMTHFGLSSITDLQVFVIIVFILLGIVWSTVRRL